MKESKGAIPWKDDIRRMGDRLHRDYGQRVAPFAQGLDLWGNSTIVGVDIRLGGRVGPMWGHQVRCARKRGAFGLLGPREIIKDFSSVEAELRQAIEGWLKQQESKA
jgi:hypothetical protein